MKKRFFKWLSLFLSLFLAFQTGCANIPGNLGQSKAQTQQEFSDYTNQIFCSEVTASTLNMHYSLAHPENYGISDYKVTYGNVSADTSEEVSLLLENWMGKIGRAHV